MSEDTNLNEKFSLKTDSSDGHEVESIGASCHKHKESRAYMKCPICSNYMCEKCKKVLAKNKMGQFKMICMQCWRNFEIKTGLFFATVIILILYIIFGV